MIAINDRVEVAARVLQQRTDIERYRTARGVVAWTAQVGDVVKVFWPSLKCSSFWPVNQLRKV